MEAHRRLRSRPWMFSWTLAGLVLVMHACQRSPAADTSPRQTVSACGDSGQCQQVFCDQQFVPAGPFWMGSNFGSEGHPPDFFLGLHEYGDPSPRHERFLPPFCIDRYEVTVERYEACVRAGACDPGTSDTILLHDEPAFRTRINHYPKRCAERGELCPTCPANCRSYEQAESYCRWIGRRLCTEAEWERVASGPGPGRRSLPWGSEPYDGTQANLAERGPGHVLPVNSYPKGASVERVFNLAGNVYEWVADSYRTYLETALPGSSDPSTAPLGSSLRVGRGGCFLSRSGYFSYDRTTFHPEFNWGCVGIRCCSDPVVRP